MVFEEELDSFIEIGGDCGWLFEEEHDSSMSPIDHLHKKKTQVPPFHDHLSLLCSQFLAHALQPINLSHQ